MANASSDNFGQLQSFFDSVRAVTLCSKAGDNIVSLKEKVRILWNEAEKTNVKDDDFQEYKNQLCACFWILNSLEEPSKMLNVTSVVLKSEGNKVFGDKQLTPEVVSELTRHLNEALAVASDFKRRVDEFIGAMGKVREFCLKAYNNAGAQVERLNVRASSERSDADTGGTVALLGAAAAALGLGILTVVTGGAALVVAGAAAGAAAAIGGTFVAVVAGLTASELDQKAAEFCETVNAMQRALAGVDKLKKEMNEKIVHFVTDEVLECLVASKAFFSKIEEDRKKLEKSARKNEKLQDDVARLQKEKEEEVARARRNEQLLLDKVARMTRELEETKLRQRDNFGSRHDRNEKLISRPEYLA